jgi:hypothetical protein
MKFDMKLKTSFAALGLLVGLVPAGFAQQSEKAVPTPEPRQEQQVPSTPTAASPQASGMQAAPDAAAQTFTGTVVKVGEKYVLRTTDNMTYQLDDQEKAKDYEGKQVKVTGGLDAKGKLIHVQNVEAAS